MHDLQNMLDQFRLGNKTISAMSMTVSIGNNPFLSFYSGTLTKKKDSLKIRSNSLFEIGSNTKLFAAAIILQLEAEGKLNINDKVSQWLPQYPAWGNVTIKQLLNMTSGVRDYVPDCGDVTNLFNQAVFADPTRYWSLNDIIRFPGIYPNIDFIAGTNWNYSNTGYVLLGLIIQEASGKSIEENMKQRVLIPLDLKNTIYNASLIPTILPNMVHGYYQFQSNSLDITNQNISSIANTAGGMLSTSADLTEWLRQLFAGKVLAPAQLTELESFVCASKQLSPSNTCVPGTPLNLDSNPGQMGYSLGLIGWLDPVYGHILAYSGGTYGFEVMYFYFVDKDLIITVSSDIATYDSKKKNGNLILAVYNYFYPSDASTSESMFKDL